MNQQSSNFGDQRQIAFGHYLRGLRKRIRPRLTQKQVAAEFHINLCEMEKGIRPVSIELSINLARKYGVPVEEMLERKYSPQLPLLTSIMRPTEVGEDLMKELHPEEMKQIEEEVKRYTAFLLLKRVTANTS